MNEEFVTYEEALALKKKGFSNPCLGYYFKGVLYYNAAPYAYNGEDHFQKLGFQTCTQVMKDNDNCCLAPLKQQVYINLPDKNNKVIECKKGEIIIIKII